MMMNLFMSIDNDMSMLLTVAEKEIFTRRSTAVPFPMTVLIMKQLNLFLLSNQNDLKTLFHIALTKNA